MRVYRTVLLTLMFAATLAIRCPAEDSAEAAFQRAATLRGPSYIVLRDMLARQDDSITPFLQERANHTDWRQQHLAELLLLRRSQAEMVARWRATLQFAADPMIGIDAGSLNVTLSDNDVETARRAGVAIQSGDVTLGPKSLAVAIDLLFEDDNIHNRRSNIGRRCLQVVSHYSDDRMVQPLMHLAESRDIQAPFADCLVARGKSILPKMYGVINSAEEYRQIRRALVAADVIGRIGEPESASVLIDAVNQTASAELIAACCEALRRVGSPEGPEFVMNRLIAFALGTRSRSDDSREAYATLRATMLAYGKTATATLVQYESGERSAPIRAIASGILADLRQPKTTDAFYESFAVELNSMMHNREQLDAMSTPDVAECRDLFWRYSSSGYPVRSLVVPKTIQLERAALNPSLVSELSQFRDAPLAFQLIVGSLTDGPSNSDGRGVIAAAEFGDRSVVDVYRRMLAMQPRQRIPSVIEALILLGDPSGIELLNEIIQREGRSREKSSEEYRQNVQLARQAIPLISSDVKALPSPAKVPETLRIAYARSLTRRGDLRGIGVLFKAAVDQAIAPNADVNHRDAGKAHRNLRSTLVSRGVPAIAMIDAAAGESESRYAGLLAECIKLRITRPELVRRFEKAGAIPVFLKRSGPDINDYRHVGKQIATLVGAEGIPLLEAAIVWNADYISIASTAFALAEFKQDRSIDIIATHSALIGWGKGVAGAALHDFGEKGIVAAKLIPAANPALARFNGRSRRHRIATAALAMSADETGVDAVIEGLRLAAAGKIAAHQAKEYLRLADKYQDHRLVEPIIAVVDRLGDDVQVPALRNLVKYDTPLIKPVCLRFLGDDDQALLGLCRIMGDDVFAKLIGEAHSDDPDRRRRAVRVFPALHPNRFTYSQSAGQIENVSKKATEEHRSAIRKLLIEKVRAEVDSVRDAAAIALVTFTTGRNDAVAIKTLVDWLNEGGELSESIRVYLVSTEHESIGPMLLTKYRADPKRTPKVAMALAELQYLPAVDAFASALEDRLESGETDWIPEPQWLAEIGDPGFEALLAITTEHANLYLHVEAILAMCRKGHPPAFEAAIALLSELAVNGLWDPRVLPIRQARSSTYASHVRRLAEVLLSARTVASDRAVAQAFRQIEDADTRDAVASLILHAQRSNRSLADVGIIVKNTAAMTPTEPAEIPLLEICGRWHEAVVSRAVSDSLRDQIIAGGEDSLQIGLELFYDWPTPTAAQIDAAAGNLVADDPLVRCRATAMLAVRAYPKRLLDESLRDREGEVLARGLAIRQWRSGGGQILDVNSTLRGQFTDWMLKDWPIIQLRRFVLPRLDRLATIPNEAHIWSEKPLWPLLASLAYSPDDADRERLATFAERANVDAVNVANSLRQSGISYQSSRWEAHRQGNN